MFCSSKTNTSSFSPPVRVVVQNKSPCLLNLFKSNGPQISTMPGVVFSWTKRASTIKTTAVPGGLRLESTTTDHTRSILCAVRMAHERTRNTHAMPSPFDT